MNTAELTAQYVLGNYGRFPVAFERGRGSWIWDEEGKRYLDFGGGIAVCSLGHCPDVIQRALADQSAKLIHCSNLYQIPGQARLAGFIVEEVVRQPGGKVFFCNSGAEANDALIKLARKHGNDAARAGGAKTGRYEVITCLGSFHGRTLGGIAATGQEKVKAGFEPMPEGFHHVPFNDSEALRDAVGPRTAAILVEAVQGEGGVHVASADFLRTAAELRDEHGLLLMFDEVQCGLGRTGDWCGWRTAMRGSDFDLRPDAVSWAKGLAGGFPMGAIWVSDRISDVLGPGSHGSTFGGAPLASAVGLAVLGEIGGKRLFENAENLERKIRREVETWGNPLLESLRGLGLILGFVLNEARFSEVGGFAGSGQTPSLFLVNRLREAGLLTVPAGPRVVRWLPALNVSGEEVEQALAIQKSVLDTLADA